MNHAETAVNDDFVDVEASPSPPADMHEHVSDGLHSASASPTAADNAGNDMITATPSTGEFHAHQQEEVGHMPKLPSTGMSLEDTWERVIETITNHSNEGAAARRELVITLENHAQDMEEQRSTKQVPSSMRVAHHVHNARVQGQVSGLSAPVCAISHQERMVL